MVAAAAAVAGGVRGVVLDCLAFVPLLLSLPTAVKKSRISLLFLSVLCCLLLVPLVVVGLGLDLESELVFVGDNKMVGCE